MESIKLQTKKRREKLAEILREAKQPVTGSDLARCLGVSRQVIVGDIGILRAQGMNIFATLQGYRTSVQEIDADHLASIFCRHDRIGLEKEFFIILKHGGKIKDVAIEHPLYGEFRAALMIESIEQAKDFLQRFDDLAAEQLSIATGGFHYHMLEAPDQEALERIKKSLKEQGILVTEEV